MARDLGIPERLRFLGLDVEEIEDWETRGDAVFNPRGCVVHHTAGAASGDMPSLNLLIHGRSDLAGPLCHVGLARSARCYVVASGRANHAGSGGWRGLVGNSSVHGIEAESVGNGLDWTAAQREAYPVVSAALIAGTSRDAELVCAHREWTTRKPDPRGIDMPQHREVVAAILAGGLTPQPTPVPEPEENEMPLLVRAPAAAYLLDGGRLAHIADPTNLDALPKRILEEPWVVTAAQIDKLLRDFAPA